MTEPTPNVHLEQVNVTHETSSKVPGFFARFFSFLLSLLVVVVATPVVIIDWTINFVKSLIGAVIFWIVGKISILIFMALLFGLLHNILGWVSEESTYSIFKWYFTHIMGSELIEKTPNSFFMFPYFNIEVWFILGLALLTATVSTIERFKASTTS